MKLHVENFQSIGLAGLEITGLTVIVGPSNRGKSALVRAIEGACFNKPGDSFVRAGQKHATVVLTLDDGPVVRWDKGKGVNQFELTGPDGTPVLYNKVGTKAPDPLQALGFRDVLIGARLKDDGTTEGGEWVRPQLAHQFDPPFLLGRPGTFISEVLTRLSRLGVLQRASKTCSADLRAQKSLLKIREQDLAHAQTEAERLAEVPALRERLSLLQVQEVTLRTEVSHVEYVRRLTADRHRIQQTLAAQAHWPEAVERAVPGQLAETWQQAQRAADRAARYTALRAVTGQALPAARRFKNLSAALSTLGHLRALAARRRRAHPVASLPLPAPSPRPALDVEGYQQRARLAGARELRLIAVARAVSDVQLAQTQVQFSSQALDQFKAQVPVCPVCSRPW